MMGGFENCLCDKHLKKRRGMYSGESTVIRGDYVVYVLRVRVRAGVHGSEGLV